MSFFRFYIMISLLFAGIAVTAQSYHRPNILWISCEDLSPHFSFYGDSTVSTPHLDRLAREGIVYDKVFATAGVCAPSRCAIITGVNQVTSGGHNMRTLYSTFPEKTGLSKSYSIVPPPEIKAFPEFLRAEGYYCTNNSKTDYQFEAPVTVWDDNSTTATWRNRKPGQPFFAVFNYIITHESQIWQRKDLPLHADPSKIKVPPYYPDTRTVRKDMARFYSNVADLDSLVGGLLHQLEEDGLMENTIIFFWSDHGDGLPFCKRELYDRGIHIPLVIRFPGKARAGERDDRLMSTVDFAPTVLSLAGLKPPAYMQGNAFLGKHKANPHQYIYAARDRMDSEYDRVRAVRDKRYKYIRNFYPGLSPYQNIEFRLQQDMMKEILELKEKGKLDSIQMKWFAPGKPVEELYDLQNDPFELNNLVSDASHRSHLIRLRKEMDRWLKKANDLGAIPEKELVKKMWQGKDSLPRTHPVVARVKNNKVILSCSTPGASIAYKIANENWQVYTKPFTLMNGQQVKAVAQRIGYEKSEEITHYNTFKHSRSKGEFWVDALRCEYLKNPMGIENQTPLLSWEIISNKNGTFQSAYEILIASSLQNLNNNIADVWNPGKIISGQSVHIIYKGAPLLSRQQCFWKIRVWDQDDNVSPFSAINTWEMGLLQADDWKAKWISRFDNNNEVRPAPLFRKEIQLENDSIKKARVYISGLGYYELYINGKKTGNHILDPMLTRYDKRVHYVSYDVSGYLQPGKNAIGVMLGNGWYNQHTRSAWDFDRAPWRNAPVLICQLEIEYHNGSVSYFYSDSSWKTSSGSITFDGIRNGEHYDARLDKKGWTTINYNDKDWQAAVQVKGPSGILHSQLMPPIQIINTIAPKKISQPKPGIWLVDFGIGIAGSINLSVKGNAGATITIKYGEKLNADGTLDQRELARFIRTGDTQTDRYTLKGEGQEKWSPRFVYHGFQYAEISGFPGELTKDNIEALEIHTNLANGGNFSCSNDLLNKLQKATCQSFLSNYHGYPEDCPHREKIGWSGDAQLVAEMGLYNFDMARAYLKWIDDFADEQKGNGQVPGIIPTSGWGYTFGNNPQKRERGYGPQWEGAYITIPWNLYLYSGDSGIIKKYYTGFKKYIDYLADHANNYLLNFGIDDHKYFKTSADTSLIATGYFYQLTAIVSKMAAVAGHEKDIIYYTSLAEKIKQAYNTKFYQPSTSSYDNGGQTSLSLALYQGLVDEGNKDVVTKKLLEALRNTNWHFDAGVLGVKAITHALIANNYSEELYTILTKNDYPSFGNWISKGTTTLWQDWQGERSLNHIMFGSFTDFFYKSLAGINVDPKHPGFKHIILRPRFVNNLQWVKGSHHSPYGWISSEWKRKGGKIIYECVIPVNTTATLEIPAAKQMIRVNSLLPGGDQIKIESANPNIAVLMLMPGKYRIEF